MSQVTFGQLIQTAERHFGTVTVDRDQIPRAAPTLYELRRMTRTLGRALDGLAPDPVETAAGTAPGPWRRAAADLRETLRQATDQLSAACDHIDDSAEEYDRVTSHLAQATDALTAARDLLRSHTTVGYDGTLAERSEWALVVMSQPVARAMISETARWASMAGALVQWLSSVSGLVHGPAQSAIAQAGEWLWTARETIGPALAACPMTAADEHLLAGIPLVSPPERRVPGEAEPPAELHAGIAETAGRLRSAAFTIPAPEDTSGLAWARNATAAAIVSDVASLALNTLAMRAVRLNSCPVDPDRLAAAAIALSEARNAWEQAAGMWQIMTTDTQSRADAATPEISDLVVRMGRLVFASPVWTPAKKHQALPLAPEALAPAIADLVRVLDAVHQAADALARMAQADLQAIRAAGQARRLYMPQAVLWGRQVLSRSYLPAPRDRVQLMGDVYQVITSTSRHAAQALGTLVIDTAAPSRAVALARIATPAADGPSADSGLDLDTLRPRLRSFDRRRDWQVTRVDDLDARAVISAYQDQGLTLQQCAFRFATSDRLITVVLKNNDIPLRPAPGTSPSPVADDSQPHQAHSPAAPDEPSTARARHGPVEGRLHALGVTDTSLLLRAAALDRAGRELLTQAQAEAAPGRTRPARLAAKDTPREPGGRTSAASSHQGGPARRQRQAPADLKPARAPGRASGIP
jgi:hypothetical protein